MSDLAPELTLAEAKRKLERMWEEAFPPLAQRTDALIFRGEQEWTKNQGKHLPLTLAILRLRGLDASPAEQDDSVRRYREANPAEKALLLMVGYSVDQLALCMAYHYLEFGCRKFVTFPSKGSQLEFSRNYQRLLGYLIGPDVVANDVEVIEGELLTSPNDPSRVFKTLVDWLRNKGGTGRDPRIKEFAIDVTGGQKPMDAGASAVAGFYGRVALYLDSEEYDSQLRRPLPHTSRYRRLVLPNAAFSHRNRDALLGAIEGAQFGRATALFDEIKKATDEYSVYRDEPDKPDKNLDEISRIIIKSRDWFEQGDAGGEMVEPQAAPAAGHQPEDRADFRALVRGSKLKPREIVEHLQARCGEQVPDGKKGHWLTLFGYVVDEYYRLKILLEQGHHRDVVMGSRGLAELVVDSLFFLPWFRPACRVETVRLSEPRQHSEEFKKLNEETGGLLNSLEEFYVAKPLDPLYLHLNYPAKIDLLRLGQAEFKGVWAKRGSDSDSTPWRRVREGETPADVEIDVEVGTFSQRAEDGSAHVRPMIDKLSRTQADKQLGFPRGEWEKARNAMTHSRSPLDEETKKLSDKVMGTYLPRIIELFRRIGEKGEPVDFASVVSADGCEWLKRAEWSEAARVPWKGEGLNLQSLLELDL